jgi:uncharacterized protein with NRDE domain
VCLILLGWQIHPELPLIVAANRDEFHRRPAAPSTFWSDAPRILAGRDLEAGGTWMGVARDGRFAAVTNYRGAREPSAPASRGSLVAEFLKNEQPPSQYVNELQRTATSYSGFNLLAADESELWWLSNRDGRPRRLAPGIYGLGNLLLDSPEVVPARTQFEAAIRTTPAVEPLFSELAKARIVNPQYGTRCSTVLLRNESGGVRYAERSFAPDGTERETLQFELTGATARAA